MTEKQIDTQPNNPLHGITLEQVVTQLERRYGWAYLAANININCFKSDPSVKSSLKFLRRTLWAREKVEALYVAAFSETAAPSWAGVKAVNRPAIKSKLMAESASESRSEPKPAVTSISKINPWTSGAMKKS